MPATTDEKQKPTSSSNEKGLAKSTFSVSFEHPSTEQPVTFVPLKDYQASVAASNSRSSNKEKKSVFRKLSEASPRLIRRRGREKPAEKLTRAKTLDDPEAMAVVASRAVEKRSASGSRKKASSVSLPREALRGEPFLIVVVQLTPLLGTTA